jgi:VanZ family protein
MHTEGPEMEKLSNYSLLSLLLLLSSPLFFFGGPDYHSPRLLNAFWNLGHLFFFGLFVVILDSYLCSKRCSMLFRVVVTVSVLLFVGLAIDLIQLGMTGRFFSWSDLFRDLSGGVIVLFWRQRGRGDSPIWS